VQVKGEAGGASSLGNVTSLDGGQNHTLALKDGAVYSWGHNGSGQLGTGPTAGTGADSDVPVQVHGAGDVGFLTDVLAVAAGGNFSLALVSDGTGDGVANDGTVWAWGDNFRGQLGNNSPASSNVPVQVHGADDVGFLTDVVAIAGGSSHSLAVKSDGTVWAWGYDGFGQLGDSVSHPGDQSRTPVQVQGVGGSGFLTGVSSVAGGGLHSLALMSDGTVYAWGYNGSGGLGNGGGSDSTTPVQVKGEGGAGFLTGATDVAAGSEHSLAIKDGTVYAWGLNNFRQLGDDTTVFQRNAPVKVKGEGGVGFLTGATDVAAGAHHSLAVASADNTVWAWGRNEFGSLGNGAFGGTHATPVQAIQLIGATQVAAGDFHSLSVADADTTAPTTTASPSSAPNAAGWRNSDVTVNLSAADNLGGSGVKQISYSATGAQTIASTTVPGDTAPVAITAEGETTITYSAKDVAGNVETPAKNLTIKLDKTAPATSIDAGSPSGPIKDNKPTFDFSGSDALTSTANLVYSHKVVADGVDPGSVAWSDFSAATSATLGGAGGLTDGSYTFHVKAKDLADNEDATPAERTFTVDTAAPNTTATPTPAPNAAGWNNSDVTVNLSADDGGGSGVKEIVYSASGAQTIPSTTDPGETASILITSEGETTITYSAKDHAGNTETPQNTLTIKLDKTTPETNIAASSPSGPTNNNKPTFNFDGSDNLTAGGDLRFFYQVDDSGSWTEASGTSVTLGGTEGLTDGEHTFSVKAVDQAGNEDAIPAERTFTVDTAAPTVSSVTPPNGRTGVRRGTNLTASFSERMDRATLTKSTFKLLKVNADGSTTQIINVAVTSSADGLKARLNPFGTSSTLLAANTRYRAVVTIGAKDLAGNRLDQKPTVSGNQPMVWSFTTGSSG
jgi:alpha-tubulin suppressor-like RCC1 family protein